MVKVPKLTKLGFCGSCKKWFEIAPATRWLPIHVAKRRKKMNCRMSGNHSSEDKYLVKTDKEARILAEWIKNDDGHCLFNPNGHSLVCGDGNNCDEERRYLAKALAEYYLEKTKKKTVIFA